MTYEQKCLLAAKIVTKNEYMTVGSFEANHGAWVSPVAYAYDKKFNFYFISLPNSKHAQNFRKHPKVTVAIFDSRQPFGEGVGLQIEGIAKTVRLPDVPQAFRTYMTRKWPYVGRRFNIFLKGCRKIIRNKLYRVYQVTPTRVWMNDPDSEVDRRIEVTL